MAIGKISIEVQATLLELMIKEFMEKHGQYIREVPGYPPVDVVILRLRLMHEELFEFIEAIHESKEIHEVADSLGDLLYVVIGTMIAFGLPVQVIMDEIHRSNMTKAPLNDFGKGGKVSKSSKFEPPRLREILQCKDKE